MAVGKTSSTFKVVIVGAGLGGLSCAIACLRSGLEVEVLEKAAKFEPVGAGIQVPPNASRVLNWYGLMPQMMASSVKIESLDLRRYSDGKLLCARTLIGEKSGIPSGEWLVIHRADYHEVLLNEAQRLGAVIKLGATVTDIDFEKVTVTLGKDEIATKIKADVVIGADGLWSTIRNEILNKSSEPIPTGDLAYRGTFSRTQLLALNDSRVEQLCNTNSVTLWMGPRRHCVFYPIEGGNRFNLVLLRPDNLPQGTKTVQGDIEEMRETFDGWDVRISKIISCISSVLKWKLYHHEELDSWTKGSTALLGDACHPTLPYQAQGAAMAVEDGAVLGYLIGATVERLEKDKVRPSVKIERVRSALGLYEKLRKNRTTLNVKGAINNRNFYHMSDGPEQQERDSSLAKVDLVHGKSRWEWIDSKYQRDMLGFNAVEDAQAAFRDWWDAWERETSSV